MDQEPDVSFGEALVQELLWIHDVIRRDLAVVLELARTVRAGEPAASVQERLAQLEARGPLWQLKFGCLHYCRHVHGHHTFEDQAWFPGLRNADPGLGPVVDRLQLEHEQVAELLGLVETRAAALDGDDSAAARASLADVLQALGDTLLAHLAFEEEAISPTLRTLTVPPWMVPPPA